MVEMKIRCPTCKNVVIVHGNSQEKIFITCPKCNAQGVFTFPVDDSTLFAKKERNTIRPIGVTILAILAIIGALSFIFNLGFYASISDLRDSLVSLNFFLILMLLLSIVLIVILFIIAYGFWKGLRWSWFVAIILLIIVIIIQIIAIPLTFFLFSGASVSNTFATFYFFTIIRSIIFVVLYNLIFGLIIFYLTRPHVRTYFHVNRPGDKDKFGNTAVKTKNIII
jgi:phage FluMu protein Com